MLECDSSSEGVGVVLMQGGHPITFESRKVLLHEWLYSIYNKETLVVMHALAKFKQCLLGHWFKVKTDLSVQFFLEQHTSQERQ